MSVLKEENKLCDELAKYKRLRSLLINFVFIISALVVVMATYIEIKITQPNHYAGVVIDKLESCGRSCHYSLLIRWDKLETTQPIAVDGFTFKRTVIGSRYSTSPTFVPLLGAAGWAYNPDDPEYPLWFMLLSLICKLYCIIVMVSWVYSFLNARRLANTDSEQKEACLPISPSKQPVKPTPPPGYIGYEHEFPKRDI